MPSIVHQAVAPMDMKSSTQGPQWLGSQAARTERMLAMDTIRKLDDSDDITIQSGQKNTRHTGRVYETAIPAPTSPIRGASPSMNSRDAMRRQQVGTEDRTLVCGIGIETLITATDLEPKVDEVFVSHVLKELSTKSLTNSPSVFDEECTAQFKRTGVILNKDYKAWNIKECAATLKGPCSTPAGLAKAFNNKFIKRLCAFFRPDNRDSDFCHLPWTETYIPMARLGALLIETLLSAHAAPFRKHVYFVDFINSLFRALFEEIGRSPAVDSKNSPQPSRSKSIVGSLSILSPTSSPSSFSSSKYVKKFRPFSRESVTRRLSREYFGFLKILSSHATGVCIS